MSFVHPFPRSFPSPEAIALDSQIELAMLPLDCFLTILEAGGEDVLQGQYVAEAVQVFHALMRDARGQCRKAVNEAFTGLGPSSTNPQEAPHVC